MPFVCDIPITIETNEALCCQGTGGHPMASGQVKALFNELLANGVIQNLLQPAIAYNSYPMESSRRGLPVHHRFPTGDLLPPSWRTASHIVAAVVTIGPKLEKEVARLFACDQQLRAVVLDGLANTALNSLTRTARELVGNLAFDKGCQMSYPVFPGGADLPISAQKTVVQLAGAENIGVRLTSSDVMWPLKSISMVMALGPDVPAWDGKSLCSKCSQAMTCRYKLK